MRTFGLIGELSPEIEWRGNTGTAAHLMVFPADDQFEVISRPGFHGDTVSVAEDRIRSVAECIGLPNPIERSPAGLVFMKVDPRRQSALRNALSRFHATITTHGRNLADPQGFSNLEFDVVAALVEALQTDLLAEATTSDSPVRSCAILAARDYIEDHADEPPTIEAVCRAVGVSWRSLNYAFREFFGVTPKQYLQATRLDRVRKELRRVGPTATIADVANRWGFWHMGQFAKDYKRQFGELPSQTRRTSR